MPPNPLSLLKAMKAIPEQRMLQGVYRGYAGAEALPEQLFAANQRQLAEFYAARRAAQTGEDPHVDMLLIDPGVGRQYRLHPPGAKDMSGVRKLSSDAVEGRANLYAEGGRVQNPDQMTHKPFNKAANPITQLLRGWAAGTAGLPGDLEGLARLAQKYTSLNPNIREMDTTPVLPTSDFYQEWLPGKDTNVGGEAMGAIGSLFGGAGATSLARPVARAGGIAGRQALARLAQAVESGHPMVAAASPMNVVKAKGGNWLNDSVERSVRGLKTPGYTHISPEGMAVHEGYGRPMTAEELITHGPPPSHEAANNWIDKQLTRYIKNEMSTPEDPIRALAERGILHVNPEQLNFRLETHGKYMEPGQTAVAQSPMAKSWEGASDLKVFQNPAGIFLHEVEPPNINSTLDTNPWLAKVPPDTPVHAIAEQRALPADLGFDHLMDEMRNMLNPESGLPPELLMKYSSLNNVSVPQMVERVAKVNEWREAQKVAANQALANNAATVLHKDYPEKGFKWVQLKAPERTVDNIPDTFKKEYEYQLSRGFTPEQAINEIKRDIKSPELADALKYEGDTMGHCVGGYCPDVLAGKSQIFSLRDSKGQPHTTIEVRPAGSPGMGNFEKDLKPKRYNAEFERMLSETGQTYQDYDSSTALAWFSKEHPQVLEGWNPRIVQIKGKGNRKPNDEYLPFVQDFVKSGKWADVGDLQNTNLINFRGGSTRYRAQPGAEPVTYEMPSGYLTSRDAADHLINQGADEAWARQQVGDFDSLPSGYANGGLVHAYNPEAVNTLASQLLDELKAQHGN